MVRGGIKGVHVTSPQVTPSKIARVIALNAAARQGFSVVIDDAGNLAALDAAALAAGQVLDVLVDFSAGTTAPAPRPRTTSWRSSMPPKPLPGSGFAASSPIRATSSTSPTAPSARPRRSSA